MARRARAQSPHRRREGDIRKQRAAPSSAEAPAVKATGGCGRSLSMALLASVTRASGGRRCRTYARAAADVRAPSKLSALFCHLQNISVHVRGLHGVSDAELERARARVRRHRALSRALGRASGVPCGASFAALRALMWSRSLHPGILASLERGRVLGCSHVGVRGRQRGGGPWLVCTGARLRCTSARARCAMLIRPLCDSDRSCGGTWYLRTPNLGFLENKNWL